MRQTDRVPIFVFLRSSGTLLRSTSLVRRVRRARPPSPRGLPWGRPVCSLGPLGSAWGAARWRPRSIRPMSAAHGFCFQNDRPLVSAHSAPHVPRGTGAIGSRRWSRFGEPADVHGAFSSPRPSFRRTSDVSSLRGLPRRNASVHRRRPAGRRNGVLRVEPESLGLLCRARDRLRHRFGPEASSSLARLRSDRRPGPLASPRLCVFAQSAKKTRLRVSAVSPTLGARPRASDPRDLCCTV